MASQTTYTCSVKGCGRKGPVEKMSHVQEFGKPSVDAGGQILNPVCASCGRDAEKWGGDRLAVYPISETLRILAANVRRREEEAAAEAAREKAAREFFGKLGSATQPANGVVKPAEEDDSSQQAAAKARRAEKRMRRDSRFEEWEERRNGAAHGYLVTAG